MKKFLSLGSALLVVILIALAGCDSENPIGTDEELFTDNTEADNEFPSLSMNGSIGVAWPFGGWQNPSDWTGWTSSKTDASTHVGAEYFARDLNQKNGLDWGINIYAGFAGKVVKVYTGCQEGNQDCNGGYGNEVVIYDSSRKVALRYAHLSYVAVSKGQMVSHGQYLGKTGNTGRSTGTHLHIVGFENINNFYADGYPVIPTTKDSDYYACAIYFYCW